MAGKAKGRIVAPFPWRVLRAPLTAAERGQVRDGLANLLRWQCRPTTSFRVRWAPDATPFVSLYAGGVLRGCMGCEEGSPTERLTRAFLRALHDPRFSPIEAEQRHSLAAEVSYIRSTRSIEPDRVAEVLELGTDGVAYLRADGSPVHLLPNVARDRGIGTRGFLHILARKAGLGTGPFDGGHLFAFETDDVVARQGAERRKARVSLVDAASWLARLIDEDGSVCFAIDPRTGRRSPSGPLWHARASVAVRALWLHGGHSRVERARRWLRRDVDRRSAARPWKRGPTIPPAWQVRWRSCTERASTFGASFVHTRKRWTSAPIPGRRRRSSAPWASLRPRRRGAHASIRSLSDHGHRGLASLHKRAWMPKSWQGASAPSSNRYVRNHHTLAGWACLTHLRPRSRR